MLVWQKGVCIMANLLTENGGFDVKKKKCSVWNCTSEQLDIYSVNISNMIFSC